MQKVHPLRCVGSMEGYRWPSRGNSFYHHDAHMHADMEGCVHACVHPRGRVCVIRKLSNMCYSKCKYMEVDVHYKVWGSSIRFVRTYVPYVHTCTCYQEYIICYESTITLSRSLLLTGTWHCVQFCPSNAWNDVELNSTLTSGCGRCAVLYNVFNHETNADMNLIL